MVMVWPPRVWNVSVGGPPPRRPRTMPDSSSRQFENARGVCATRRTASAAVNRFDARLTSPETAPSRDDALSERLGATEVRLLGCPLLDCAGERPTDLAV